MIITRLRRIGLLLFSLLVGFIGFFQMFARAAGRFPGDYAALLAVTAALFIALWVLLEIFLALR